MKEDTSGSAPNVSFLSRDQTAGPVHVSVSISMRLERRVFSSRKSIVVDIFMFTCIIIDIIIDVLILCHGGNEQKQETDGLP